MNQKLIRVYCLFTFYFLGVLITHAASQSYTGLQHYDDFQHHPQQKLFIPQEIPLQANDLTTSPDRVFGEIEKSTQGHEFNSNHGFSRAEQSHPGFHAHAVFSISPARKINGTRRVRLYLLDRSLLI